MLNRTHASISWSIQFCIMLLLGFYSAHPLADTLNTRSEITGFGQPLSPVEIERYAITIFPDGTNLPDGQGTVVQGKALYQVKCTMCHGENGIEGPAARLAGNDGWFSFDDPFRILRIKEYPLLLISVGSLWPYATTIFDYIRRAMPHYAPKSLNNDDVYALTAYILYLNDQLEEAARLDKRSILEITMSGKKRSVSAMEEVSPNQEKYDHY